MTGDDLTFEEWLGAQRAPAAQLIGEIAIAWNTLHATLGLLLAAVATPDDKAMGLALWNSLRADIAQRQMLEAAIVQKFRDEREDTGKCILDVINVFPQLSDDRNNAIHASYDLQMENGTVKLVPSTRTGNRSALKLDGKELLSELRQYRDNCETLNQWFILALDYIRSPVPLLNSLPPTPKLPRVAQSMTTKGIRPKTARTTLKRPRLSSPK